MRKAILITRYVERNQSENITLCEFHKTIEMDDVPPLGYTVTFPQDNGIARFYIEDADIQNKSGILTLYNTMAMKILASTYRYEPCILYMLSMRRRGWLIVKPHHRIQELWSEAQGQYTLESESSETVLGHI